MKLLWSICELTLAALTFFILLASLSVAAGSSVVAMVVTLFTPGISQVYWIATVKAATGTLPQPLTMLCEVWLVLFAILIYARDKALRKRLVVGQAAR